MKFKLENLSSGLIVCHILESLTKSEVSQIVIGINKLLANGKGRIIIRFEPKIAKTEGGPEVFEQELSQQKELAQKLGGGLRFVVPGKSNIAGSYADLDAAIKSFGALLPPTRLSIGSKDIAPGTKDSDIHKFKSENERLLKQVNELTEMICKPSSDEELKKAVEFYKNLATQNESTPPGSAPATAPAAAGSAPPKPSA